MGQYVVKNFFFNFLSLKILKLNISIYSFYISLKVETFKRGPRCL